MLPSRREALMGLLVFFPIVLGSRQAGAAKPTLPTGLGPRVPGGPLGVPPLGVADGPRPLTELAPRNTDVPPSADIPRPFANLAPGTPVGPCTLISVQPIEMGAVPFLLRAPDGEEFRVNGLLHDSATPGVARAGDVGLYLANGGKGATRTKETHGLGVLGLARALGQRPRASGLSGLLTLRERASLLRSSLQH